MTGDHLRSVLPTATMSPLGNSQMSLKDLDLVVLTSDVLFQTIELMVHSLCLLILQLDNRLAVKADVLVHVVDG